MMPKIYKTISPAIFAGLAALIVNCDLSELKNIKKERTNQERQNTINIADIYNGIPSKGWIYIQPSVIKYIKEKEIKYKRT